MRTVSYLLVFALASVAVPAAAGPGYYDPRPDIVELSTPDRAIPTPGGEPGILYLHDEVAVMPGDAVIVTTWDTATYGVTTGQMGAIAQRFYSEYPDEFDGIAVFTTFLNMGPDGFGGYAPQPRYSMSAGWSGATGIGLDGIGYGGGSFGSAGALISVVNMGGMPQYRMTDDDLNFHGVFGQEFGHTWLAFMPFQDPDTGQLSGELLGRDGSHWAANFHSDGSVMDGMSFSDNGDGTFTAGLSNYHYGPLDLYAMGVIAPEEVSGMFLIRNARYNNGDPVDPVQDGASGRIFEGLLLRGDRLDLDIDDVIAANGPRLPAAGEADIDFRVAFILVTAPDEDPEQVAQAADKLAVGRHLWERKHTEWTWTRSVMCTAVSAPCPPGVADITSATVREDPDDSDGDGSIEPGEGVLVDATFVNWSRDEAVAPVGQLFSEVEGLNLPDPETLPNIPGGGGSIDHTFKMSVSDDACGVHVEMDVTGSLETRQWKSQVEFQPGVEDARDPLTFEEGVGWAANPDGTDDASTGAWERGRPQNVVVFGAYIVQPTGGADGPLDSAWFTGPYEAAGDWEQGELNGTSTLVSAPLQLGELKRWLVAYDVWYSAIEITPEAYLFSSETHLVVEASNDGGETWVQVDSVSGDPLYWETREFELVGMNGPGEVLLRFTAQDDKPADERVVEVGIDNVRLLGLSDACADGDAGGCGCRLPSDDEGSPLALWLLGLATIVLIRRRRK